MNIIKVTQEHINNGNTDCTTCPIALALMDMGYSVQFIFADEISIYRGYKEKDVQYKTSAEIEQWIISHDDHGKQFVEPFEFDLDSLEIK